MGRRHRESRGRHSSGTPRATARSVTPRPAYERHSPGDPPGDAPPADARRTDADTAGQGDVIPVARAEEMPRAFAGQMPTTGSSGLTGSNGPDGSNGPNGSNELGGDATADPTDGSRAAHADVGSAGSLVSLGSAGRSGATTAQLRRFIKSRPYVPLHELRRRFVLNGHDDDVVPFDIDGHCVWVGLPPDEGRMLADLVRQGEVGCELSLDPDSPVVVGVFPIRPMVISRPGRPTNAAADSA
jgi:hypothetical protein